MTKTAVLFDLDGVIINTEEQYTEFWTVIGRTYLPENPDFPSQIKGHTLTQILSAYFADEAIARQVVEQLNDFETRMSYPYIEGAIDFVSELRKAGIPMAIVTSSNKAKMECMYQQHPEFSQLFDRIFTAENARRSKPAPDCYLDAAQALGLTAKDCFVFEDSISGLTAGRDSGATVIGLTTTIPAARIASLCQCVINDFTEITVAQMCELKK